MAIGYLSYNTEDENKDWSYSSTSHTADKTEILYFKNPESYDIKITSITVYMATGSGTFTDGDTVYGNGSPITVSFTGSTETVSVSKVVYPIGSGYPDRDSMSPYSTSCNLVLGGGAGKWFDISCSGSGTCICLDNGKSAGSGYGNYAYVTYEPNKRHLYVVAEGGISSVSGAGDYTPNSTVTINATPATGYIFKEWRKNSSTSAASTSAKYSFSMPSEDVTYHAWGLGQLTVHGNGGTIFDSTLEPSSTNPSEEKILQATTVGVTTIAIPGNDKWTVMYNRSGQAPPSKSFLGYNTDSSATSATYDPGGSIATGNPDLYAIYKGTSYTVTFYDGHTTTPLKSETVSHGGSATPPNNPTWTGHTFKGWFGKYTNVTGDTNVTAMWDSTYVWIRRNNQWIKYAIDWSAR